MDPEKGTTSIKNLSTTFNSRKFGLILAFFQIAFIVLFAVFVEYDWDAIPASKRSLSSSSLQDLELHDSNSTPIDDKIPLQKNDPRLVEKYPLRDYFSMYGDIQVMIFCAFGLLIACFKRFGYSSVSIALVLGAFVVQWSILVHGFFDLIDGKIKFSLITLISSDFAVAAILISTCVVLGTVSPIQYLVLAFLEVIFYALNEWINLKILRVVDVGGAIYLHTFAAYFGLAVSAVINRPKGCVEELKQLKFGSQLNELLAMIGTLFLFIYWPSFNSVFAPADLQNRAVLNTSLSLITSTIGAFVASSILLSKNKLSMTIIQNGSLAGGVAIGATADLLIGPYFALLIGFAAGVIAVVGFVVINPILERRLKLIDICGVHFLHGLPGIFAGLVSTVVALLASEEQYGSSFWQAFPAIVPTRDSSAFAQLKQQYPNLKSGDGRSLLAQASFQLLALLVSILLAIVAGLICGLLLKLKIFDPLKPCEMLSDQVMWSLPKKLTEEEEATVLESLEKLSMIISVRRETSLHSTALKDQLRGLEACLKA